MFWWVLWFAVGFIVFLLCCVEEMRGVSYEYDVSHDSLSYFIACIVCTACGGASIVIYALCRIKELDLFTKLIYEIVNIGVKKEDLEAEQ